MEFGSILLLCVVFFADTCTKADARYCSFESEGELKYYMCQRNEYCCNFGCCLSPTFQFYQLWYYWLMVIFMFLLCSGGQWWYRYWLQGRYAGDLGSSMPYRSGSYHMSQPRRPPRPARVAYHPARDAVVLQHIWKPNYPGGSGSRNSPPPSYSNGGNMGATTSRDLIDSERGGVSPKPSPYLQLYGPPPSYDQVIREARGSELPQPEPDEGPAPVHLPPTDTPQPSSTSQPPSSTPQPPASNK